MFNKRTTADMVLAGMNLENQYFLCTGINSGLGKETIRALVKHNATVFGTCRTMEKAQESCEGLGPRAIPLPCDLSDFQSVLSCIKEIKSRKVRLQAIIANAGLLSNKYEEVYSIEKQFLVNHVSHHLLITRLLDVVDQDKGRIVLVSSELHKGMLRPVFPPLKNSSPLVAYQTSKLANVLFAKKLQRAHPNLLSVSLHPGIVMTEVVRNQNFFLRQLFSWVGPYLFKTVPEGASTQVFAAVHPLATQCAKATGYLENCQAAQPSRLAHNVALQDALWAETERLLNSGGEEE